MPDAGTNATRLAKNVNTHERYIVNKAGDG
jgi:hypothetical protein